MNTPSIQDRNFEIAAHLETLKDLHDAFYAKAKEVAALLGAALTEADAQIDAMKQDITVSADDLDDAECEREMTEHVADALDDVLQHAETTGEKLEEFDFR
jgi:uncharacterized protein YicC (UPF0701 family)